MKTKCFWQLGAIMIIFLATSCRKDYPDKCKGKDGTYVSVKVFATGLNNPRGLEFGPNGYLYVAEGGKGGTNSSEGLCTQVVPPIGPYKGSPTGGRISRITPSGERSTVTENLPSAQNSELVGGDIVGVGDVAFIGNTLYALVTGGGCSHGVPSIPNGVVKINPNGTWTPVANTSAWLQTHPSKNPEPGDFEPDGDWYSMVNKGGDLYAIEANHGELVKITTGGEITRVVDISAAFGHIVPTAVTYHGGNFFVGNLNPFPIVDGSSSIYKVTGAGEITEWATGFTTILGLAFDKKGRLYVLENTSGAQFPTPGKGQIVRVNTDGSRQTITTGLSLPTGLTFGPDGRLYVSNWGFGPTSIGGGEVLQIDVLDCGCDVVEEYVKNQ